MYLAGKEALQLHQNPKEAGAAELAAKGLGWALLTSQRGTPLCLHPVLRSKPSRPHTSDTGGCQEAGGHFLLGEQLAAPLG